MSINPLMPPRILGFFASSFILAVLLSAGCGSAANMNLGSMNKVIEMTKGPCYGRCPVFTLTVYDKGIVSYKGERYTDRLGTYVKKLEKEDLERLLREFKNANLWQYKDAYRGRIPDMQSVSITYYEGSRKKTVTGKEIRPNSVKWLESLLDQVAQSNIGWVQKEAPQDNIPDYLIPNELVVELAEGIDPEEWAKSYVQADMLLEKRLNDTEYWIFSFDDGLITPEVMLEQVRMDEDVISAEFNKQIYNKISEEGTGKDAKKGGTAKQEAAKQQY
ncbi:MAG: hypothetical protein KDD06_10455 [Phaeodactylibacter sp.]|nr:hypothetical protein [Phaeodactylibacter sp.]MCB9267455.1 hypothetical protein [Lewinellaceae bacterium]MCB9288758.1 hypothetical protein [Lewinellaceae bacterium]